MNPFNDVIGWFTVVTATFVISCDIKVTPYRLAVLQELYIFAKLDVYINIEINSLHSSNKRVESAILI